MYNTQPLFLKEIGKNEKLLGERQEKGMFLWNVNDTYEKSQTNTKTITEDLDFYTIMARLSSMASEK